MQKRFVIHYACAGLEPSPDKPVTAISVYDLDTFDEYSFSLEDHKQTSDKEAEASMLEHFFEWVAQYPQSTWIHWHMDSNVYGFEVLQERYRMLLGKAAPLFEETLSLSDAIFASYKDQCSTYPKLLEIARDNKLHRMGVLTGQKEAEAYEKRKFKKVSNSSMQKVLIMANLYHHLQDGTLVSPCQARKRLWMIFAMSAVGALLWLLLSGRG